MPPDQCRRTTNCPKLIGVDPCTQASVCMLLEQHFVRPISSAIEIESRGDTRCSSNGERKANPVVRDRVEAQPPQGPQPPEL